MLHPSWGTPGMSRAADGAPKMLPCWSPSVADLFDLVKRYQTITGTCDVLGEGGATCEGLAMLAKGVWGRRSEIPGNESGKVMRIAVAMWCCNGCATWGKVKNSTLMNAEPFTDARRFSPVAFRNVLDRYDVGVIIGPASARVWSLERSWELGPRNLHAP